MMTNRPGYVLWVLLFILSGCGVFNTSVKTEKFDDFYTQFHEDQNFQIERVQFPLEGKYAGPEGIRNWEKSNWEPHLVLLAQVSGPGYQTDVVKTDDSVQEEIKLMNAGYSAIRRFELIGGQWYLVYYEVNNY